MNPIINGKLSSGGLITRKKHKIEIVYNCVRRGESIV
jgi:hypothetical protein